MENHLAPVGNSALRASKPLERRVSEKKAIHRTRTIPECKFEDRRSGARRTETTASTLPVVAEQHIDNTVWARSGRPANMWVVVAACTALTPQLLLGLILIYCLLLSGVDFQMSMLFLVLGIPTFGLIAVGIYLIRRVCQLDLALKLCVPGDSSPPPLLFRVVQTINKRERQAVVLLPIAVFLLLASVVLSSTFFSYRCFQHSMRDVSHDSSSLRRELASKDEEIASLRERNRDLHEQILMIRGEAM